MRSYQEESQRPINEKYSWDETYSLIPAKYRYLRRPQNATKEVRQRAAE